MVTHKPLASSASLSELLGSVIVTGDEKLIHTEPFREWELNYHSATNSQGVYLMHSVEMALGGAVRARMTTVRPSLEDAAVVALLREKAHTWIEEYERRDHTGATDFGPL
ncbi:MAG: hypothetical protein J0H69_08470 [Burkholderiales bacterium]|jgi:hypothetical protein|nr:hypothetical protein [Burkholderiales bacterium]